MNKLILSTNLSHDSMLPRILFLIIGIILLSRAAWMCDDAYITFRVIDNFVNGYGMTWNIDERVQVYTNPLWMLLLSSFYVFTNEIYFTGLAVSIVISLAAIYIAVFHLARSKFAAILVLFILFSSKAFSHYTASGLENPLTFLLIALFCFVYLNNNTSQPHRFLFWLSFICGLAMVNRLDNIVLFLPALLIVGWQHRSWKVLGFMTIGFLPFIAWEIFSLIYYGLLFPNTAYAKLGGGIPHYKFVLQGMIYLMESLFRDPITLFIIAISVFIPFWTECKTLCPLVLGVMLSIFYVINVGGDFMSGRFLSAPLFLATIIFSQLNWQHLSPLGKITHKLSITIILLAILSSVVYLSPINWIEKPYEEVRMQVLSRFSEHFLYVPRPIEARKQWLGRMRKPVIFNVSDERMIYYPLTGLWRTKQYIEMPNHFWAHAGKLAKAQGEKISIQGGCGFFGFYAGPTVHVLDVFGLTDPLLARLPPVLIWRVGHLERQLPAGYLESIKQNRNLIEDKELSALYEKLRLITRGEIFDMQRWKIIWELNFM